MDTHRLPPTKQIEPRWEKHELEPGAGYAQGALPERKPDDLPSLKKERPMLSSKFEGEPHELGIRLIGNLIVVATHFASGSVLNLNDKETVGIVTPLPSGRVVENSVYLGYAVSYGPTQRNRRRERTQLGNHAGAANSR